MLAVWDWFCTSISFAEFRTAWDDKEFVSDLFGLFRQVAGFGPPADIGDESIEIQSDSGVKPC